MHDTWVLVTNGSQARLFETEYQPNNLHLLKEFSHPDSREKGKDLASDRAGHYQGEITGASHGAFIESIDPKSYEIERFAVSLANELDVGRNANSYNSLIIVSSPHFHGLLNKHMNQHVASLVDKHIEKDYTALKEAELLDKIR